MPDPHEAPTTGRDASAAQVHDGDRCAVDALLARMERTWAAGDADGYAACFAPDATYVIFVGTTYRGRDEIARTHASLFTSFLRGTRIHATVLDVRFPAPRTAVVVTCGDVGKRPPRDARAKVQTLTLVREGDDWLCTAYQNTKTHRLMERVSFALRRDLRPADALVP